MGKAEPSRDLFERDLIALIPAMRAFARSLCKDPIRADDLVQEALAKAWRSRDCFEAGTNLKAWTFQIVRNQYFSERRRDWRWCALEPSVAESTFAGGARTDGALELDDVRQALNALPDAQREALILVGAGGLSYEEAAQVMGVAIGTVKSRLCRARIELQRVLERGVFPRDKAPPSRAFNAILSAVSRTVATASSPAHP